MRYLKAKSDLQTTKSTTYGSFFLPKNKAAQILVISFPTLPTLETTKKE